MKKTSTKSPTESGIAVNINIKFPTEAVDEVRIASQIIKLVKTESTKTGKRDRRVWLDLLTAGAAEKGWVIE